MDEHETLIHQHNDVVKPHRFSKVIYQGTEWDLSHIEPFAFREEIRPDLVIDVVVLFSCHCFTHGLDKDPRDAVPDAEIYMDGTVCRVLNPQRWQLSREKLPGLVQRLRTSHIKVLGKPNENYATFSAMDQNGAAVTYVVFFTVKKDNVRKKRLIMRVQSAYAIDSLTKRLQNAGKVNLAVLLRATYEGRTIKA